MKEKFKLFRYNNNVLLVINQKGIIKTLYTPFRVFCTESVGNLKKDSYVYVEEVLTNQKDDILFVIFNGSYLHHYFKIPALYTF